MNKLTVITLGTALLLVSAAAAADTYRWVDNEGNAHYGDRPVRGSQEVDVRVPGEAPRPAPAPVADAADEAEPAGGEDAAAGGDDGAQVRAQLCDQAKERLARYEKADGIYEEGPDGQKRELSLDERVDTILKARQSAKELCEEQPSTAEAVPAPAQ